jgi:hypothetical protein
MPTLFPAQVVSARDTPGGSDRTRPDVLYARVSVLMSVAAVSFSQVAPRASSRATRSARPAAALRVSRASPPRRVLPGVRHRVVTSAVDEDDALVESVDRAAATLDLIIKETVERVFVEEAVEEVIPGDDDDDGVSTSSSSQPSFPSTIDKEAILRAVVRKHLPVLDGSFMAALSAYVQVAESGGDFQLLSMLAAIREEVLSAVTGEMGADIQVVQLVSRLKSKEARVEVLRVAHTGGGYVDGMEVPSATIQSVEQVASRLVDEMESQDHVPNWQLLWQLLLVRETTRQMHPECADDGVFGTTITSRAFSPSEIPKAEASMIKELCVVNESLKRRALVHDTLDECRDLDQARDADGGKIKLKRVSRGFKQRNEMAGEEDEKKMDVFDVRDVRPGRLIDCVINMRVALKRDDADSRVVDRLKDIYFECCDVVLEQADKGAKQMEADERLGKEMGDKGGR